MKATFGQPGSITPASFENLPAGMKREGLLLLKEMGLSLQQMAEASGMSAAKVRDCLELVSTPWSLGNRWEMGQGEANRGAA